MDRGNYIRDALGPTVVFSDGVSFPLEYIVFGSADSTDVDMVVNIPWELTQGKPSHYYLKQAKALDERAPDPLNRPFNVSFVHWRNGQLAWAQKGSELAETNNSLVYTFSNHTALQMFRVSPVNTLMERDPLKKIIIAVRSILGPLSSMLENMSAQRQQELLLLFFTLPEVRNLGDKAFQKTKTTLFVGTLANQKRNALVRKSAFDNAQDIGAIMQMYDPAEQKDFVKAVRRATLRLNVLGPRLDFLQFIQADDLSDYTTNVDEYKGVAFQLGQTLALLDGGVELFEKATVCQRYSALCPFLKRDPNTTIDDRRKLVQLIHEFAQRAQALLPRDAAEQLSRGKVGACVACFTQEAIYRCGGDVYCSKECATRDWNEFHQWEC